MSTPENRIDAVLKSKLGEGILFDLYKYTNKHEEKQNIRPFKISLGWFDDGEEARENIAKAEPVLKVLKSMEIIMGYDFGSDSVFVSRDRYFDEDITVDFVVTTGSLDFSILSKTLQGLFEEKRTCCQRLADYFSRMMRSIEIYFQEPIIRDERLNRYYIQIAEKIKDLLNEGELPDLKKNYKQPFTNLFSAALEMSEAKRSLNNVMNQLSAFYGTIQQQISHYELRDESQETDLETFDQYVSLLEQRKSHQGNAEKPTKRSLKGATISFDANKTKLLIGDQECPLPPYKNEFYLCKVMFQHPLGEPVEWQDIYSAMAQSVEKYSEKVKDAKENRRPVYDAMNALNSRIKELCETEDELFRWNEKTVIRVF